MNNVHPWNPRKTEFWDAGDIEPFLMLSQKKMANVMMALVRCDATLHQSHCLEKVYGTSELTFKPSQCAVVLRVELPVGAEKDFEEISGLKLTEIQKVGLC